MKVTLLPEEIDHYAWLIAGLVVAAARASTPERLADVQAELEEALRGLIVRLDVVLEPAASPASPAWPSFEEFLALYPQLRGSSADELLSKMPGSGARGVKS